MPIFKLNENTIEFPDPSLAEPDGLLAIGGDLSSERLYSAYSRGIFPWYDVDSPILWWSPNPRCVLFPDNLHVPSSLKKVLRRNFFYFTVDIAFKEIIEACANANGRDKTGSWLVQEMIDAYCKLYSLGIAHCFAAWTEDGALAGGLYGVALGKVFFGESMFFRVPNASKAALVFMVTQLKKRDIKIIDCQQTTQNLLRFGAESIPRSHFFKILNETVFFPMAHEKWEII